MTNIEHVDTQSTERLIGRVKWFNNKAGYGFITVTDGDKSGSDIFVHHSAINVSNQQYKYLVQGEYVNFTLAATNSGAHEYQASGVNGINGGKLMCETRRDVKLSRTTYKSEKGETVAREAPIPQRAPRRSRSEENIETQRQEGQDERKEWTVVSKSSTEKKGRGRPKTKVAAPVSSDV